MANPLDALHEKQIETFVSDQKEVVPVEYTEEEKAYRQNLIQELCLARDEREQSHAEFDDMTYSEYYDSNKKADLSYIPPKKNKSDKRIVTGITHEKDNTLLSLLLNLELQPRITAFDESDLLLAELGENVEDLVKKSREIEDYVLKRPLIYREMISQGDVFVEETWRQDYRPDRKLGGWKPGDKITDAKFVVNQEKKCFELAEVNKISGKQVFLGSTKIENIWNQELVATYEEMSRARAEAIYSEWDRWQNVPFSVDNTELVAHSEGVYRDYSWNLSKLDKATVGILKIQKKFSNEYMIMINGVMMLPVGYALTEVSPSGEYTLSQGKLEPIPDFAYSKSQPSKTKVDQATLDEFLKLFIIGFQQARKPPMGNTTKKVLPSSIFDAAKITPDLKPDQLFPLIKNAAIGGQGEFQIYNLIKQGIEDKSINKSFEGGSQTGDPTATQLQQEKQQQMLKLGLSIDGVVNLERQMWWKRIYTVSTEYTKPIDTKVDKVQNALVNIYRSITVDTNLNDGTRGKKVIEFKTDNLPTEREQKNEEVAMGKQYGTKVQKVYMNPIALSIFRGSFYMQIVPTDKNNDKLAQMLFVNNVRESLELFGYESHNLDYIKQRYANVINEDPNRWYNSASITDMLKKQIMPNGEPAKGGTPMSGDAKQMRPKMKAIVNS